MSKPNKFKVNSSSQKYKCETCKKTFTTSSQLNIHNRIHSKQKPFACDQCQKSFSHICLPKMLGCLFSILSIFRVAKIFVILLKKNIFSKIICVFIKKLMEPPFSESLALLKNRVTL
jgi:hypothetical protein